MPYELLHIYGPFSIHSYGFTIAIGLLITVILMRRNQRFIQLHLDGCIVDIITVGVFAGLFGGRLFYFLSGEVPYLSLIDFLTIWQGGLSILGCIIGILCVLPLYVWKLGIPIVPVADLFALYTPLLQAISRIGCFLAGCCYGKSTTYAWGVVYTDPQSMAPLHTCIHPTQLYSAGLSFVIFLFSFYYLQNRLQKPGELFSIFLMLIATERFITDFWRDDQLFTITWLPFISFHQSLALLLFIIGLITYIIIQKMGCKKNSPIGI